MELLYSGKSGNPTQDPLTQENTEDKECSYQFYSETISNGEVRGYVKKFDSFVEQWRAPFLKISKITYGQKEEYHTFHRLFPLTSNTTVELLNEVDFNDYFRSSEQIYTKVALANTAPGHNNNNSEINLQGNSQVNSQR